MCTGNGIGDEGAKGLGEALKLNTTITTLYLRGMKHEYIMILYYRLIHIFIMCIQIIVLVMKELKYWEKWQTVFDND